MKSFPKKLRDKKEERKANNTLRQLGMQNKLVDFHQMVI